MLTSATEGLAQSPRVGTLGCSEVWGTETALPVVGLLA